MYAGFLYAKGNCIFGTNEKKMDFRKFSKTSMCALAKTCFSFAFCLHLHSFWIFILAEKRCYHLWYCCVLCIWVNGEYCYMRSELKDALVGFGFRWTSIHFPICIQWTKVFLWEKSINEFIYWILVCALCTLCMVCWWVGQKKTKYVHWNKWKIHSNWICRCGSALRTPYFFLRAENVLEV